MAGSRVSVADALRMGVAAVATLALAAGCGLGAGPEPANVALLVTRGFGAQTLVSPARPKLVGADTVMRMLERNARVGTRYGGGFVQSINRIAGGGGTDWFYFVNGVDPRKGAAEVRLHAGDHVWWDRHDWSAAISVPAVVGSFPEPFVDGYAGKRLPLRIECTQKDTKPCTAIEHVFARYDLVASLGCLLCAPGNQSLRVVVGPDATLRADPAAALLTKNPAASGVYARFEDHGRRLVLLDQNGRVVRTAGAGAGLVAATRWHGAPPVWYVTGTDDAGVAAAVRAFNAETLDEHFAVAVVDQTAIPLPDTLR